MSLVERTHSSRLLQLLNFKLVRTKIKTWGSMLSMERVDLNDAREKRFTIDPVSMWYRIWWYLTTVCAVVTAFFTPWEVAFNKKPGVRPYDDFEAFLEYFLTSIFIVDIVINFRLAFLRKDGLFEHSTKEIFWRYFRFMFWIDLIGVLPIGAIAVEAFDEKSDQTVRYLALFRLLRLVRLHRIFRLFHELETNLSLSPLAVIFIRNLGIVLMTTHVAGCLFFFISKQHGLFDLCELDGNGVESCKVTAEDTWIGATVDLFELTKTEEYIYTLYWSITTMTTVGYGDLSPKNTAEVVFAMIYMLFNIALNSYILGTITLLVVKADEKTGALRDCYRNITTFAKMNELPSPLRKSLKGHMYFNLAHPEIQDDYVLQGLPAGLHRSVLKEMYAKKLQATRPFHNCSPKFVASLVRDVRLDTYLPFQQIFDEGDVVHELHLMVAGEAVTKHTKPMSGRGDWKTGVQEGERLTSGCIFVPEAYFKGMPMPYAVETATICRVLVIPKEAYENAAKEFPHEDDLVKKNMEYYRQGATSLFPFPEKAAEESEASPSINGAAAIPHSPAKKWLPYGGRNQKGAASGASPEKPAPGMPTTAGQGYDRLDDTEPVERSQSNPIH